MKIFIEEKELNERIKNNFNRLCEPYYDINEVFPPAEYGWPGDKEGRALLAFASHASIHGKKVPCMDKLVEKIPEKTNEFFFFGNSCPEYISEQQLSGHSWYLRGLLLYYELYGDERALKYATSTVENLYLPLLGKYSEYPVEYIEKTGGVSGDSVLVKNGWLLSSDTGCAFMSVDGLSHYYVVTKDKRVLALLDEMRGAFEKIDKIAIKAQTHCCLTASRGFVRLYKETGEEKYLNSAEKLLELYVNHGMTYTYQNFNWWGKGDTWTEPCAVIDSLMLSIELFKITGKEEYRVLGAKVYHNGFSALQVGNGGAGTTTTVSDTESVLKTSMYEAPFCCTMRLAEGLYYISQNKELLYANTDVVKKDKIGRYVSGDIIYAEVKSEASIDRTSSVTVDGIELMPIVKYYNLPKEVTDGIEQRVVFK